MQYPDELFRNGRQWGFDR